MSTFSSTWSGKLRMGSESIRYEFLGALGSLETKHDVMAVLAAGQALGSETTLWTAEDHGDAETIEEQFKFAILMVDPDSDNDNFPTIDVEVSTTQNTAGTVEARVHRVDRNTPFIRATSRGAATFTAIDGTADFTQITMIRVRNRLAVSATEDNDVKVRLLLLGLP